jgi:predicted Fe-S protein YdhL (DUF1289 family)
MSRPTRPMSPCLSICTLNENKVCMGCLRSLDEIKGWALLSPDDQWTLVEELAQRKVGHTAEDY